MAGTHYPGLSNQIDPAAEEVYVLNHPDIQTRRWLNPGRFNDVNYARDWLQRGGIYDYNARKHDNNWGNTLEGQLEKGYSRLAQDRARLSGLNYPAYQGKTLSPMSDLTQRARGLQEYYGSKPTPYSDKLTLRKNSKLGKNVIRI